jgi:hypothetical protein
VRIGKPKAIVAIARKLLLVVVWHVLKKLRRHTFGVATALCGGVSVAARGRRRRYAASLRCARAPDGVTPSLRYPCLPLTGWWAGGWG